MARFLVRRHQPDSQLHPTSRPPRKAGSRAGPCRPSTSPASPMTHPKAMRLQGHELERTLAMLRSLEIASWSVQPTVPPGMCAMYQHVLGACKAGAYSRENIRHKRHARCMVGRSKPRFPPYRAASELTACSDHQVYGAKNSSKCTEDAGVRQESGAGLLGNDRDGHRCP